MAEPRPNPSFVPVPPTVPSANAKSSSFNVKKVLAMASLIAIAYIVYTTVISKFVHAGNYKVGAVVQTQFLGNPAALMTALLGPKGEYLSTAETISQQDIVNAAYCDVPGALGTVSSWFTNAGLNYLDNPTAQANAPAFWGTNSICRTSDDCRTLSHMLCGTKGDLALLAPDNAPCKDGHPTAGPTGSFSICINNDPANPYSCSLFPGSTTGRCVGLPAGTTSLLCSSADNCHAGQTCSSAGTCTGSVTNHVLHNTNWLAEGTVSAINGDNVNVEWHRIQMLYPFRGPSPDPKNPWWYTNCRFIAGDSAAAGSQSNANVQVALLGRSANDNPEGFAFLATQNAAVFAGVSDDFCVGPASSCPQSVSSAWALQSVGVPKSQLTGVKDYTIKPLPVTAEALAFFNKNYGLVPSPPG